MRKIDTTQIIDPTSQQPFTGKSLKFIQDASIEAIGASVIGLIGANYSATTVYVLSGCTITSSVISNGYVFYGGEVYTFIGADTSAYADTAVVKFQQPYDTSIDPVMFSDGVNKYIHELPQFYIADDVSGSSAYGDYADVVFVNRNSNASITCTSTSTTTTAQVTGSSWTTPARITNFKISVTGRATVTSHASGATGAVLKIRNVTAATTLAQNAASLGATIGAGQAHSFPISIIFIARDIAASSNIDLRIESDNALAAAVTIDNCYLTYEEIRD